jgi:Domain of unknown function (DUF5916)/Carbohydrate family 9 binding domain-like
MRSLTVCYLLSAICYLADANAQQLTLPRATAPVTLDGDLSDAAWNNALVISKFYEYYKSDNTEPPMKTIARVMYDDRYLYVGVDCRDDDPSKIRAPLVERDHVFGDQDNLAVIVDARGEGKVALELRVNPSGVQGDALLNDASGSEDFSPDFFYDTATKITSTGWIAEYRIPLSTLRYKESDPKTFGFNILRTWPRQFRYSSTMVPIPKNGNCLVCRQLLLGGITNLPHSQHLIVAPYVTTQVSDTPVQGVGTPLDDRSIDNNAGVDVKWSPTTDTAIDATLNPDFSQIESDVAEITTNQRFAVFLPEKRPFFLEGTDLFDTPIQAVYTRTITSPRWGVRATGKSGSTEWTTLIADDRGGGRIILPTSLGSFPVNQDFESIAGIGRVRHEIGRSAVGMLTTIREYRGGGHNRLIGPDFEWRPTEIDQITGQYLFSDTENPRSIGGDASTSHGARVAWNHTTRSHDWFVAGIDYGKGFRADNGFVPQAGIREEIADAGRNWWPEKGLFTNYRLSAHADHVSDEVGTVSQEQYLSGSFRAIRNSLVLVELHPGARYRLDDGRTLSQSYVAYLITANPSRTFSNLTLNGSAGEAIDFANSRPARGYDTSIDAIFRPTTHLQAELILKRQELSVRGTENPGHLFTAEVTRVKLNYSFSASSQLRAIGQYVDVSRETGRYLFTVPRHSGSFNGSLLYSYRLNWQTVLFAGYGDDRTLNERTDLLPEQRSLFVKVSYAIQR